MGVRYFTSSIRTLLAVAALVVPPAQAAGNGRSRDYWVAIRASDFAVPEGEQPFSLLLEMNELLGSTDPVLRDEVAYSAAARWVYRKRLLSAEQNRELLALWRANLSMGLGEGGTDSVLRRSFSALDLSLLTALDNEAPFLTQEDFDGLLRDTLDYLASERDTRGYHPEKGWMHAAGHTADVLKFMARSPRLAVAGLNPHAGEDGTLGKEDSLIVRPAIERLIADGIDARGPLAADTMFHEAARKTYDAALCMYHDQALIPIKTLAFDHGVNVTLGLPFVRTSPDHGTAFDIAGTGRADPSSLVAALKLAARLAAADQGRQRTLAAARA